MKTTTNSLPVVHKLFIYLLIIQTLFLKWLINKDLSPIIALILLWIIIAVMLKKNKIYKNDIIVISLFSIVIIINLVVHGIQQYFFKSFYVECVANIIVLVYVLFLNTEYRDELKKFILDELYIFLNIYFWINIPILLKQFDNSYFMMRYIDANPMYEDHITGLLGASATHELTIFWILLTIINLYKISVSSSKFLKIIATIEIVFMLYISSKNDNTAFYIVFPVIILQFMTKDILKLRNVLKVTLILIVTVIFMNILYNNNEQFNTFFNTRIMSKLIQYGIIKDEWSIYNGEEERIMLYNMAIERGNGYGLGMGIGSIQSYGEPSIHRHFGMSEISLRVYEGGLIYLLTLIYIFSYFAFRIFKSNKLLKIKIIGFCIIEINIAFLAIYTLVFRRAIYALVLGLVMCLSSYKYGNNRLEE